MRGRARTAARAATIGFFVTLLGGCTDERQVGESLEFTFAWWVPLVAIVACIAAILLGLLLRSRTTRWSWALLIFGVVFGLAIVPNLFCEKVTLNKSGFKQQTGFWFAPTRHEVLFGNLSRIELIEETHVTRRGTSTSYYFQCFDRFGGNEKVPVNDLMKQGANAAILEAAQMHNIPIIDKSKN